MATPPPNFSMSSVTTEALPLGLMCAQTCSGLIPTCFATASAVVFASPVIMFTSMPMSCSARTARAEDGLGASWRDTARIGSGASAEEPDALGAHERVDKKAAASSVPLSMSLSVQADREREGKAMGLAV